MRKLPKLWDKLCRVAETECDSNRSRQVRHQLLHMAYDVVDTAYMSKEMIEARVAMHMERRAKSQTDGIAKMIHEAISKATGQGGEEENNETI